MIEIITVAIGFVLLPWVAPDETRPELFRRIAPPDTDSPADNPG